MGLRRLAFAALLVLLGCQAPKPPTPTATSSSTNVPTVAPTAPSVAATRVDALNSANAAFARGDLTAASGLYERVINTPPSGEDPALAATLTAFARFRDMVTLLAAGSENDARTQLEALQQADASGLFTRLASQLWDQYGMVGQLRGACAQLQPQISSQAGPALAALQTAGVNVDPQSLCSVPAKPQAAAKFAAVSST